MAMNSMNLRDAARQCSDQNLLRQLAEVTLARMMEFEVEQRICAERLDRYPSFANDCIPRIRAGNTCLNRTDGSNFRSANEQR